MYACVHILTRGTKEVLFGSIFHFNHIPTSLPRVETKCSNGSASSTSSTIYYDCSGGFTGRETKKHHPSIQTNIIDTPCHDGE